MALESSSGAKGISERRGFGFSGWGVEGISSGAVEARSIISFTEMSSWLSALDTSVISPVSGSNWRWSSFSGCRQKSEGRCVGIGDGSLSLRGLSSTAELSKGLTDLLRPPLWSVLSEDISNVFLERAKLGGAGRSGGLEGLSSSDGGPSFMWIVGRELLGSKALTLEALLRVVVAHHFSDLLSIAMRRAMRLQRRQIRHRVEFWALVRWHIRHTDGFIRRG